MSSGFNIRATIRKIAASSTIRNPSVLAEEIVRQIPPEELLDVLRTALMPLVREVIAEDRPHGTFTTGFGRPQAGGAIRSPSSGSAKVAAIRDGWQDRLRARYSVDGEWKFLGECTYEDLQAISRSLDLQAERYRSKAAGLRSLAALLTEHDAPTVRDLPAEKLMVALGAAA